MKLNPGPGQTGQAVRRYERSVPGELVHLDIEKLRRFPGAAGEPTRDTLVWRLSGLAGAVTPRASALQGPEPGLRLERPPQLVASAAACGL